MHVHLFNVEKCFPRNCSKTNIISRAAGMIKYHRSGEACGYFTVSWPTELPSQMGQHAARYEKNTSLLICPPVG